MSFVKDRTRTFVAGGAIDDKVCVKLDSTAGQVVEAGAGDSPIGVSDGAAASGALVNVVLLNSQGTVEVTASGALSYGDTAYCNAAGEVGTDTGSDVAVGVVLEEATAQSDIIEIVPKLA